MNKDRIGKKCSKEVPGGACFISFGEISSDKAQNKPVKSNQIFIQNLNLLF